MNWDMNDKKTTRFMEQNIHNLAYAQFDGDGKYGIPMMKPTHIDRKILEETPLQGFNFALKDTSAQLKGCHFFLHDYQFERVWNYPDRYVEVLKQFAFVLSPDFSPYGDMPTATQIFNVYRNRWCGRYWQEHEIEVIPTITFGSEESLEFCLDGVPKHSTIAISTMGEGRWGDYKLLKKSWNKIMKKLEPDTILLYGKDLREQLSGNIIYKPMISRKARKEDGKSK